VAGFEPATPTSRTWCATRLRYTPTAGGLITPPLQGRKVDGGFAKGPRSRPIQASGMTTELRTRMIEAGPEATAAAAACLRAGGLVAFPTETVYGLGADATNGAAVARLYAAKGRPTFNPLIAHVSDTAAAQRLAAFTDDARRL